MAEAKSTAGKKKKRDMDVLVRLAMGRPGLITSGNLKRKRDKFLDSLNKMLTGQSKHPFRDRHDMEHWLESAMLLMRDLAVLNITGDESRMINSDMAGELRELGNDPALEGIIENYTKIRKLRSDVTFNLNRAVTWNYLGSLMETL